MITRERLVEGSDGEERSMEASNGSWMYCQVPVNHEIFGDEYDQIGIILQKATRALPLLTHYFGSAALKVAPQDRRNPAFVLENLDYFADRLVRVNYRHAVHHQLVRKLLPAFGGDVASECLGL